MKVLQRFFTQHNTGKKCNPRSETIQGRKCGIVKMSAERSGSRDILKNCLYMQKSPLRESSKNSGIIVRTLNFKNFLI